MKNIHNEGPNDHPVYVYNYPTMDPKVVILLKNVLEVCPESGMLRCVEMFNSEARNEVQLAS